VISNPPYNVAPDILPLAWEHSRLGMAMLLRLTYLEPTANRAEWLQDTPLSNLIIFNPRPKFRQGSGSDSATVAWFVWRRGWKDETRVSFCTDWQGLT
jgi:hypothetical protein